MNKILCYILGHKPETHLGYIWGNLPREHTKCSRCEDTPKLISFIQAEKDRSYAEGFEKGVYHEDIASLAHDKGFKDGKRAALNEIAEYIQSCADKQYEVETILAALKANLRFGFPKDLTPDEKEI